MLIILFNGFMDYWIRFHIMIIWFLKTAEMAVGREDSRNPDEFKSYII